MCAMSYFDLPGGSTPTLAPRDIAQATADALQTQQTNNLAVAQAPNLRPALQQAEARRHAQQNLALGTGRLALGTQRLGLQQRELGIRQSAAGYRASQFPYEVGLGALSGGVRLAGGFAALKDADRTKAFYDAQLAEQQRQGLAGAANAATSADVYARIQRLLESQGYPKQPGG